MDTTVTVREKHLSLRVREKLEMSYEHSYSCLQWHACYLRLFYAVWHLSNIVFVNRVLLTYVIHSMARPD